MQMLVADYLNVECCCIAKVKTEQDEFRKKEDKFLEGK